MNIKINYGSGVSVVPLEALSAINRATKKDIEILLNICSPTGEAHYRQGLDAFVKYCGATKAEVEKSLTFWNGSGVIDFFDEELSQTAPVAKKETVITAKEKPKDLAPVDELPKYTSTELSNILEGRKKIANLIDECQRALGKMFSTGEISKIIGLYDYLALDDEYILMLCAHAVKMDKPSVHYIEKQAFSLYNEGINSAVVLGERLKSIEDMADIIGHIRSMFGMKSRALSSKEKRLISEWIDKFKFDMPMIKLAYDLTVDKIKEPSISYTNAILSRWFESDIKTPKDVEKAVSDHKQESENKLGVNNFNTDEFFEKALKHGYEKYGSGGKDGV